MKRGFCFGYPSSCPHGDKSAGDIAKLLLGVWMSSLTQNIGILADNVARMAYDQRVWAMDNAQILVGIGQGRQEMLHAIEASPFLVI